MTTLKEGTKLPMMLLDMVPQGYFAVRPDNNEAWTFVRLSRPTFGRMKGALKFQSLHGDRLENRWVRYPSGTLWYDEFYKGGRIEQYLMLVIADFQGGMIRYGEQREKCGRCNAGLTDERSRWYTIGPECEKIVPWYIEAVAERKGIFVPGVSGRE